MEIIYVGEWGDVWGVRGGVCGAWQIGGEKINFFQ